MKSLTSVALDVMPVCQRGVLVLAAIFFISFSFIFFLLLREEKLILESVKLELDTKSCNLLNFKEKEKQINDRDASAKRTW